jgi:hypothetical protein
MIFSTVSSSTLVTEVVNQASFYLIFLSLVSKKLLLYSLILKVYLVSEVEFKKRFIL